MEKYCSSVKRKTEKKERFIVSFLYTFQREKSSRKKKHTHTNLEFLVGSFVKNCCRCKTKGRSVRQNCVEESKKGDDGKSKFNREFSCEFSSFFFHIVRSPVTLGPDVGILHYRSTYGIPYWMWCSAKVEKEARGIVWEAYFKN